MYRRDRQDRFNRMKHKLIQKKMHSEPRGRGDRNATGNVLVMKNMEDNASITADLKTMMISLASVISTTAVIVMVPISPRVQPVILSKQSLIAPIDH
ncbi:hypothetical protein EYF80_006164 [Liparis tanakae]|uniref:Uncharacterized protein n=1 Tax=Liparis tanakae TaxID=230148 RepID=A0A4Z2J0E6_9TELE|nr:hypothetical protein EYF80_006164 [Liparis tanakae]